MKFPFVRSLALAVLAVTPHAAGALEARELRFAGAEYQVVDIDLSRVWTKDQGYAGAPAMMVKPYAGMFAVFDAAPVPASD